MPSSSNLSFRPLDNLKHFAIGFSIIAIIMTQFRIIACIGTLQYIDNTLIGSLGDILISDAPAYIASYLWRDPQLLGHIGEWANEPLICPGEWDSGTRPQELHSARLGISPPGSLFHIVRANYTYAYPQDPGRSELSLQPAGSILLNRTTMEYVRGDILPYGIGLGHVVLMRICWSSHPDTGIRNRNYLSKGAWAGHRFEIIEDDMQSDPGTGWTDVGRGVLREITQLWETLLGEDWRWKVNDRWLPCLGSYYYIYEERTY